MFGNIVLNPSSAAAPGLSVTPALKPTEITASGVFANSSVFLMNNWSVQEYSMIGSANKSSTRAEISADSIDEEIKNPTMLLTSPTFMLWSAINCLLTTLPLTSLSPAPCFGVTSTLVMFIMATSPTGYDTVAVNALFEQYGRIFKVILLDICL